VRAEGEPAISGVFSLGEWRIDPADGTARGPLGVRRLDPLVMDLLLYLAAHAPAVVSKQRLVEGVWSGRAVSDDAVNGAVSQLRKSLGDDARRPRFVETVPKRGYRLLVAPVAIAPTDEQESRVPGLAARHRPRLSPRVRAAVVLATLSAVLCTAWVLWLGRKEARRNPASGPARQAYLEGRALLSQATPQAAQQARLHFQHALDLEPGFALAASGMADAHLSRVETGLANPIEVWPLARAAASQALELGPELAETRTSFGAVLQLADHDGVGAEREYRRALEIDPSYSLAHRRYALFLAISGRIDSAVVEGRRAVDCAPRDLAAQRTLVDVLLIARRYRDAERQAGATLAVAPDFLEMGNRLALVYALQGKDKEAYGAYRDVLRRVGLSTEAIERLDRAFSSEGPSGVYRSIAGWIEREAALRADSAWLDLAVLYSLLGEKDRAFALLDRGIERGDPNVEWLAVSPFLDSLHLDLRWKHWLERLHLAVPSPA